MVGKGLFFLALAGGVALAAPPPPALYPKEFPREVAGYDLTRVYSVYNMWAQRGRKPALAKAIPYEPEWQDKHHWGSVVESELVHYDFSVIRIDRLERYCAGDWIDEQSAGTCDLRYRWAFVPGSLYSDEKQRNLIEQSFRPLELAALFRRVSWTPSEDLWTDKRLRQLFEQHTDLEALYQPLVEVHEVTASNCPGFARAIERLDKITLDVGAFPPNSSGADFPIHGQQTEIRLTARTSKGETLILEGAKPLFPLMQPIWDAVEACAKR